MNDEPTGATGQESIGVTTNDAQPLFYDNAMRSVSLRVPCSDWGKIRAISERFRLRESEIFRFGLKLALEKMAPLFDRTAKGVALAPLLVEYGPQLVRAFELDVQHLDIVINAGEPDPRNRIDLEDLELLAMVTMPNRLLYQRLQKLTERKLDPFELEDALKQYLREKYIGSVGS